MADKRIPQLPAKSEVTGNMKLVLYDQATDTTYNTDVANIKPEAGNASFLWNNNVNYNENDVVVWDDLLWISQTGIDNVNVMPGTNPAFWVQGSKNPSGIGMWQAGVYTDSEVLVLFEIDFLGLYRLINPTRPFNSIDFQTELDNGDWQLIGLASAGIVAATNGLTSDGATVKWGGVLTEITTIDGISSNVDLNLDVPNLLIGTSNGVKTITIGHGFDSTLNIFAACEFNTQYNGVGQKVAPIWIRPADAPNFSILDGNVWYDQNINAFQFRQNGATVGIGNGWPLAGTANLTNDVQIIGGLFDISLSAATLLFEGGGIQLTAAPENDFIAESTSLDGHHAIHNFYVEDGFSSMNLEVEGPADNAFFLIRVNGGLADVGFGIGSGASLSRLTYTMANAWVFEDSVNLKGAQYLADYSAANAANPRWIPDKAYVDSVAGGGGGDMILASAQTSTGKKTFQSDATNAGLRLGPFAAVPSSSQTGDMSYFSTDNSYRGFVGADVLFPYTVPGTHQDGAVMIFTGNGVTFNGLFGASPNLKYTSADGLSTDVLTVTDFVNPDGGGLKHALQPIGPIAAGATAPITITWPTPFDDGNYTVVVSVLNPGGMLEARPRVHHATDVEVDVINHDTVNPQNGQVHVIAMRIA